MNMKNRESNIINEAIKNIKKRHRPGYSGSIDMKEFLYKRFGEGKSLRDISIEISDKNSLRTTLMTLSNELSSEIVARLPEQIMSMKRCYKENGFVLSENINFKEMSILPNLIFPRNSYIDQNIVVNRDLFKSILSDSVAKLGLPISIDNLFDIRDEGSFLKKFLINHMGACFNEKDEIAFLGSLFFKQNVENTIFGLEMANKKRGSGVTKLEIIKSFCCSNQLIKSNYLKKYGGTDYSNNAEKRKNEIHIGTLLFEKNMSQIIFANENIVRVSRNRFTLKSFFNIYLEKYDRMGLEDFMEREYNLNGLISIKKVCMENSINLDESAAVLHYARVYLGYTKFIGSHRKMVVKKG